MNVAEKEGRAWEREEEKGRKVKVMIRSECGEGEKGGINDYHHKITRSRKSLFIP